MLQIEQESNQGVILKATGSWTIDQVAGIWKLLTPHLHGNVAINAEGVERMDSAGLQILLMAKKNANDAGNVFKILNHSIAVLKIMDLSGVLGSLRDQIRISASEKEALKLTYSRKRYSLYE